MEDALNNLPATSKCAPPNSRANYSLDQLATCAACSMSHRVNKGLSLTL